jgi:ABC-2 type transport system permease protein
MRDATYNGSAAERRDPGFFRRMWAMVIKEFVQMRRDRMTFATMIFVPILQLTLFGYAINTDPKQLPTAVLVRDEGPLTRAVLAAMKNTDYFKFTEQVHDADELDRLIRTGKVQFAVEIPASFERDVRRGDRPSVLVIADATDPVATGTAVSSLQGLIDTALRRELRGPDAPVTKSTAPFQITLQNRYNPEAITQYNIVPGLLGVVLTMTMMMFTALAVTREIERGTMESLLAMPIKPVEIMIGKIAPFVLVGFVQMTIILCRSWEAYGCWSRSPPCSRPPTLPLATPFRPSPGISFRRCSSRFSSSCPTFFSPDSCSRSVACRCGRKSSARRCRSRISCASCAASR